MKKGKTVLLVLVGLMLAFIWGHSLMSVEQSGAESLQIVEMLKGVFSRVCGLLGIGGAVEAVWITDHLVRKTAHFVEFAVLGGLLCLVCKVCMVTVGESGVGKSGDKSGGKSGGEPGGKSGSEPTKSGVVRAVCACLLGLLAAFLDETLQLFSGRGSMVADVWLDFAGVVCGVAAVAAGMWIWERGMKK